MRRNIIMIVLSLALFSCSTDEVIQEEQFEPNPQLNLPSDPSIPTNINCNCYMYLPMGGNWYGKKYYCNQSVTNMIQLSTPPQLGVWICQ